MPMPLSSHIRSTKAVAESFSTCSLVRPSSVVSSIEAERSKTSWVATLGRSITLPVSVTTKSSAVSRQRMVTCCAATGPTAPALRRNHT